MKSATETQTYCRTPRGKLYPEPHLHPNSRTTRNSTNSPQQQLPRPEVHRGQRSAFRQIVEWEKKKRHNFLGRANVRIFRVCNFRGSRDVTNDGAPQTGRPSLQHRGAPTENMHTHAFSLSDIFPPGLRNSRLRFVVEIHLDIVL